MNKEKVTSLHRQIVNSSHVFVDGADDFVSLDFGDLTGEPDNEVICALWVDDLGFEFPRKITEAGLSAAVVSGNKLVIEDSEGLDVVLKLYQVQAVEIAQEWTN